MIDQTSPDNAPHQTVMAETAAALRGQPWFDIAVTDWPAPIAHELQQLIGMLEAGRDAGGTLFQVRDLAEILIKTVVVTLGRDLIANGDEDAAYAARSRLFSGKLSLGSWLAALREMAAAANPQSALLLPELAALGKPSDTFAKAYDGYASQRNRDVGHGAFRPDSAELAAVVEEQLLGAPVRAGGYQGGLDRAFSAVHELGIWNSASFRLDTAEGAPFSGASAIRATRALPDHSQHQIEIRDLVLVRGERSLNMAPLLAARRCRECGERDAFIFDSPRGFNPQRDPRFDFLDYANGHRLSVNAAKDDPALKALADLPFADKAMADTSGEFRSQEVVALLDDILFDKRYASPEWLRKPLREHMQVHPSGVLWIEAPGHVGKTMFVRGLTGEGLETRQAEKEIDILGDGDPPLLVPIFLKREYRFDLAQFQMFLENRARERIRTDTRLDLRIPRPEDFTSEADQPIDSDAVREKLQAGFVKFATEARKGARELLRSRVILAVDGLDELPDPGDGFSPVDYLPPADQLPDNVTLLLTSRRLTDADCPQWLAARLDARYPHSSMCHRFRADVDHPDYVALLKDYVHAHSGVKRDHPRFEEVWQTLRMASGGLFLFLSFMCDRMREQIT